MIIKGGSRKNARFFAKHLTNGLDNENVRAIEFRGFLVEDVREAFADMELLAKDTRCKNFFYHADMNPKKGEFLTPEQWEGAADILEQKLGFEGQPRFIIEHEKNGRVHRHVIWSRIDADTLKALPDSLTYPKHEAAAREIEQSFGLEPVASVLVKDRETPRPERRPKDFEGFRGSQTGLKPEEITAKVKELWAESDGGAAFKTALAGEGFTLCKGDRRDFCIVDPAGKEHSLARRLPGVKAAELRDRMKDVNPDSLPSVEGAKKAADAWGPKATSEAAEKVRHKQMRERNKPAVRKLSAKKLLNDPAYEAARLLRNLKREVAMLKDDAAAGKLSPDKWADYKAAREAKKQAAAREGFAAREAERRTKGRGLQGPEREK